MMQLALDEMIKSSALFAFVFLTISLTRHCYVASGEIEILGFGVRPVNEPMGGPGPMSGVMNEPMTREFRMSSSGGGDTRIMGFRRVGPLLNGGGPPGNMGSGNVGGRLTSNNLNDGGGGGEGGGEGGGGNDGDRNALPSLGLGPGGSPLGLGNVNFEGGGDGGGFSGLGLGSGGSFGSGGRGFEGGNGGGPSSNLGAGFGGSSFGSGGGNFEGSLESSNINREPGRGGGGASPNFGAGFGGSSFGSSGGNFEGYGGLSRGPQGGPGGDVEGEGPPSNAQPSGGFSRAGGNFGGGGFGGGGGGFSGTTSDRDYGGYGGATMPSRAPPSQRTREPQPETSRGSSEENSEEAGQGGRGGGGGGDSGGASTSRRRTSLTDLIDMNALRGLLGGGRGTAGMAGTGLSLLQGTRTGRRVGRFGRRLTIRLARNRDSLERRLGRRSERKRRSVPVNLKLPATVLSKSIMDDVPDHLKTVHCGHHEVPNRGHDRDRFCHPEATWRTVLRMRPDCVCAPGYVRNSWGDCISYDQCYHCIDKHHLNMDYNLCESQCPLVCNKPINTNCPDTCYQECACRPGYIRVHPNGGPCVSIKKCLPGCSGHNQHFTLCVSPCAATCANPLPTQCPKFCAGEGCVCKPGYVILQHEPLVCVRPEECPGFRNRCHGENQVYTPCRPRCPETCWDRQPRVCTAGCAGTGCACKPGFVIQNASPLVCVHRAQCTAFNHTSHLVHTKTP
ncbi:uncharacterized protein [Dermacentor andersoni]|uniref:uncharacterized protein isoform X2 n=1 Tax=Dermacentor andersoni TaxID=34620 RepID=UPI00241727FC|nr:uncharacterized protein LOC126544692 isoform X2 [Dermacentor andersoni]